MNMRDLQSRLSSRGYPLVVDGVYGAETRAAVLAALTDPPDRTITAYEVAELAARWQVDAALIWAVRDVEASGSPFVEGRPTILFEPHRFSRATGHRFDGSHPHVSYRTWNPKRYPASQDERYAQLLEAVGLDIDAGFASASYGAFQILGENFHVCGEADSFAFALDEAGGEGCQLEHFGRFVESAGLVDALRRHDFAAFARGYNGTAYRQNHYDARLASAFSSRKEAA